MKTSKRKLTDLQVEETASNVAAGMPLREAANWVQANYGINIDHSTLGAYPEIKKAVSQRESIRRIETQETLQKTFPKLVKDLTETKDRQAALVDRFYGILENLSHQDETFKKVSDAYTKALDQLNRIDARIVSLYEASSTKSNSTDTQVAREDILSDFVNLVRAKTVTAPETTTEPASDSAVILN